MVLSLSLSLFYVTFPISVYDVGVLGYLYLGVIGCPFLTFTKQKLGFKLLYSGSLIPRFDANSLDYFSPSPSPCTLYCTKHSPPSRKSFTGPCGLDFERERKRKWILRKSYHYLQGSVRARHGCRESDVRKLIFTMINTSDVTITHRC